ncbi:hypothetical protein [Streptomyces phytophilus]|uniref:hypothetical protein n=1 Tax=Streptomyces phytophilus TaxID=722715 RepID=UPI0015F0BE64|nr:hypothetical protein [Streptomyces phytophilus]
MSPRVPPPTSLSTGSKLTVAALLVAAVSFAVQMAAGVTDTPTIPPGLVALLAAAALVAFLPGRSTPVAGPVAGLFNLVAFTVVSAADRLLDPDPASGFIATWFMLAALVTATVSGTFTTLHNYRTRPSATR